MSTTTGTIKRITDKGFGFIAAPDGTEYFFHQSACTSTPFDSLREGENVTFTVGQGPKGPRAENVVPGVVATSTRAPWPRRPSGFEPPTSQLRSPRSG